MRSRSIVITGIRDIDRKLRTLEPRVQKKYARQAIRAGLKIVATEVESQVPVDTGLTQSAVKVRAVKKRKRGNIELEVMIDEATPGLLVERPNSRAFYPSLIEYGDSEHVANPFMTRSYINKREAARQTALSHLRAGIEREASK